MQNESVCLNMGVILCKHCGEVIQTFDAEKITTYYSDCGDAECRDRRTHSGQLSEEENCQ